MANLHSNFVQKLKAITSTIKVPPPGTSNATQGLPRSVKANQVSQYLTIILF